MSSLSHLWGLLARNRSIAHAARLLGNQCNAVVSRYLSSSSNPAINGEARLVKQLAPVLREVVDIGANVGDWTDLVLQVKTAAARIVCYEPSSACVARLKARFPTAHVEVRQIAVCDRFGEAEFAAEENFGTSSALLAGYSNNQKTHVEIVPTRTLDAEWDGRNTTIDLLKIDTEGFDYHVLKGAKTLLAEQRIRFLQFEFSRRWDQTESTLAGAMNLLATHGYHIFLLNDRGLHPFERSKWERYLGYANFVACPMDQRVHLESMLQGEL